MESNNYERFITSTVENMFPRFTYRHVCFTMRINMVWDSDDLRFSKTVLLVFHRPSNYTKVLYKDITDLHPFHHDDGKVIEMKKLSDHDSCWRSDGMRWVFKTFCEAWDFFEKHGIEGRDIDPYVRYDLIGEPSYHRLLELEKTNRDDEFTYNVRIGKKIYMHEISKYMNDPDDHEKLWKLEKEEEGISY